jgi:GDP-4-dehydro-6-deoxy-D-mannose reductase
MTRGTTIVTGATGFAGRHLLDGLATHGDVVAWHRRDGRPPDRSRADRWQAVDLTDAASVRDAVRAVRPRRFFHLAGAPSVARSWENAAAQLRINALGTLHLLEAVRDLGQPCRVLIASSGQIYRPSETPIDEDAPLQPSNPYGFSKLAQDDLGRRFATTEGLDVVIARPFNHIGPLQDSGFAVSSFARQIARVEQGRDRPVIQVGNLDARRDVTDVRDVAAAYACIMDAAPAGRVYNVCSGDVVSVRALLEALLSMSDAEIRVEVDKTRLRPLDVPVVQGDPSRIRVDLGWQPRVPLRQTLADTLDWWRQEVKRENIP